ncbi:MAG: 16S ribosomal RNA methyltransferase A, partial [Halobacteria archaeon]|nr:16S ribosomal RNA methyltransferase A [Halobacteria archaeon]
LPYSASSPILFRLLPLEKPMVLTLQKEFAERMVAEVGEDDYGRLSVSAQHYADAEIMETVPRNAFEPSPEVQSAVVRLNPAEPEYEMEDEEFFLGFLRGVFTQRRKTLRNAIRNTTHITGIQDGDEAVERVPDKFLSKRAGKISPAEFAEIAEIVKDEDD